MCIHRWIVIDAKPDTVRIKAMTWDLKCVKCEMVIVTTDIQCTNMTVRPINQYADPIGPLGKK